jgi:hypothetical protein
MNQILANLLSGRKNPHVTVPVALAIVCELGRVWMPAQEHQWALTQKILLGYGMISAANSGPPPNGDEKK